MSLTAGVPAPSFTAPSPVNPRFAFNSLGGRYVLLAFLPEPGPERDEAVGWVRERAAIFRDDYATFFGVLPDAVSYAQARNEAPFRWFADLEGDIRRLYLCASEDGGVQPGWVLVDPMLRVIGSAPLSSGRNVLNYLASLGDPDAHREAPPNAPVLIIPRIFEPELCKQLIDYYHAAGGQPSGTMVERDGKTVPSFSSFKSRRDANIEDEALNTACRARLRLRLLPQIQKAFQFSATHIERYIVARYDAEDGGWFHPHRDNTTPGTAHRKFAVSINLNADDFDGGDLRFPEFGRRTYRPTTGGAVVFSCSLLHEATAVTRGTRYAFLPFLYDQAGADLREANRHLVDSNLITPPPEPAVAV